MNESLIFKVTETTERITCMANMIQSSIEEHDIVGELKLEKASGCINSNRIWESVNFIPF